MIYKFCSLKTVITERIRLLSEDLEKLFILHDLIVNTRLLGILFSIFYFILYVFYNSLYKIQKRFTVVFKKVCFKWLFGDLRFRKSYFYVTRYFWKLDLIFWSDLNIEFLGIFTRLLLYVHNINYKNCEKK